MLGPSPKSTQSGKFLNAVLVVKNGCRTAFGCALFAAVFSASAQPPTADEGLTGGTLRNEIERPKSTPDLPPVGPKPGAERPKDAKPKGETVVVSRFRFEGNTVISDAALTRAVAPYVGRPVDFDELQNAAAMASLAYRDRGYVATVSIPKQEIDEGIVTLKVAEARYGGAKIDPLSDGRVHSEIILARIESAMKVEKAVNTNVLDRAVLLLNDLPGNSVQAGLAEGKAEGETEVVLRSSSKPRFTGNVVVDQQGSRATGAERQMFDAALNSPNGRGEQYTLSLMNTEGTRYGRVGYSAPVGLDGARAGFNTSALNYHVVAGKQVIPGMTPYGASQSVSGDLSYPVIRSQQANLYVSGSYTMKWFDNFAGSMRTRNFETRLASGSVNGNWFDTLFGGASNQASASMSVGRLDLKDFQSESNDKTGAQVEGMFSKFNASISRSQQLPEGWTFVASASMQLASKNLDSSEKFYLGGANGVRAYPSSEGGGSSGKLLQFELRKRLNDVFEVRFFHDDGQVRQYVNPTVGDISPNMLHYRGYGAAVIASLPRNITLSFTASRRIGDNPNPALGEPDPKPDQDGTRIINRVWMSATMSF